jgi:hypothetical protein
VALPETEWRFGSISDGVVSVRFGLETALEVGPPMEAVKLALNWACIEDEGSDY